MSALRWRRFSSGRSASQDATVGCDYFSAYRNYMGDFDVVMQFCLPHLIRDLKFLAEHPEARNQRYGKRVLKAVREMFSLVHRRDKYRADEFSHILEDAGNEAFEHVIAYTHYRPEAGNLARRFHQHGESNLVFTPAPDLDPTNNVAEQAIRFVVIDRKISQGSRSERGRRWLERIWTVMATCRQKKRSIFEFLTESVSPRPSEHSPPTQLPALK